MRSREPAHPAIVSVELFTQAQLLRRGKYAGGLATSRTGERGGRSTARTYLLRGQIRCGVCRRRMQGATIRDGVYYRCTTRTMAPGAAAVADHPATVNLREDRVVGAVNEWIGDLFAPENLDATVAALIGTRPLAPPGADTGGATARRGGRAAASASVSGRDRAGVDPVAMVEVINQARAERVAAQAEIDNTPARATLDPGEVYAMIDALGDIGATIGAAKPAGLARLYRELDITVRYEPAERAVYLTAEPRVARVDGAGVRGGTSALPTRQGHPLTGHRVLAGAA